ncbi:MAG: hypothetical protein GY851_24310 [bacterium]|nr:hypothetical protein [bacterium]
MKHGFRIGVTQVQALCLCAVVALASGANAVEWEWNTPGDTEGWTAGNAISSVASSGGDLVATYDGAIDPWIWSPPNLGLDASQESLLVMSIEIIDPLVGANAQFLQVFYRREGYPGDDWGDHSFFLQLMPNAGKKTYTVNIPARLSDEGKPADWSGPIEQLRFDLGIGGYTAGATCRIDYMRIVPAEEEPVFTIDLDNTEGLFNQPFATLSEFHPSDVPVDVAEHNPFIETFCFFSAFGSDPALPQFEIYDEDATPVYQFDKLTDKIDTVLAAGLTPYLALGSCPVDMARDPWAISPVYGTMRCGPSDYDTYRTFVRDLFEFMDAKYGEDTVASWLYRFMTEPDNPEWWTDSREEWFKFYDYTVSAVWEANPGVRVCPGNMTRHPGKDPLSWVVPLAEHLESGAFSVPGESRPYLPPRLTFSVYAPLWVNRGGSPQSLLNSDITIRDALRPSPSLDNIPLGVDEGYILGDEDRQVTWGRVDGTEWGAAHFASLCQVLMDDGWTRASLWRAGDPDCPPPMRNVLNLLCDMNGMTKVTIPTPSRTASPGGCASALAAKNDDRVTIMLVNYQSNRTAVAPVDCHVSVLNLAPGHYRVFHKRIDHSHGNYRTLWLSDSAGLVPPGVSEYDLDPFNGYWWGAEADQLWSDNYSAYQALASNMDMPTTNHHVDDSGVLELSVHMPARSVSFLYVESVDIDGDGLTDEQEAMDLDPDTPGVQNPFDPNDPDSTGDNGSVGPDGILDGQNDWDGDGMTNADEFTWGYDPLDPASFTEVPISWWPMAFVILLLCAAIALRAGILGRRRRPARTLGEQ